MADYEAVIGLEVHAQLKTKTKIFCGCSTKFGNDPNENVCPVCAGMPGVLPVLNEKVVEYASKMGLAVGCAINETSIFARKNYFYPDLPKGYQVSQYEQPLCEHGHVDIEIDGEERRIGITRIHMEEDAGKNIHSPVENVSFVDLNRCGVPLIEIVSEPDMRSADEAVEYLRKLRAILVYLDICDGNMEEGSFRCDANVSVREKGETKLGTRTELKNMNSFRHVKKAVEYEIGRHIDLIEDGEAIIQETRLYDADKNVTQSMRGKEEAHDYRYFPDPDLLPVTVTAGMLKAWEAELPELPEARKQRFVESYGLPDYDAGVLTAERDLADYFERAAAAMSDPKKVSNFIMGPFMKELNDRGVPASACSLEPEKLARLLVLVEDGAINVSIAARSLCDIIDENADPDEFVKARGLVQISDSSELETVVDEVLAENPNEAARLAGGEKKLMGFLVGQIMKKTRGKANPKLVNELINKKIG